MAETVLLKAALKLKKDLFWGTITIQLLSGSRMGDSRLGWKADRQGLDVLTVDCTVMEAATTVKKGLRNLTNNSTERAVVVRFLTKDNKPIMFDFGENQEHANKFLDVLKRALTETSPEYSSPGDSGSHTSLSASPTYFPEVSPLTASVSNHSFHTGASDIDQLRGISSNLTNTVTVKHHPKEEGDVSDKQRISIVLNKEKISRIFIEHPEVETIFIQNVPKRMSDIQFWTLYVHSKYMYRDNTLNSLKRDAVFDNPETKAAAQLFGDVSTNLVSSTLLSYEKGAKEMVNMTPVKETELRQEVEVGNVVDPGIDLVATVFDNAYPARLGLSLDGSGFDTKKNDGIFHRDADADANDLKLRELLRQKRISGERVGQAEIDRFATSAKADPLATKYNKHSEIVLDAGVKDQSEAIVKRVQRAKKQELDASVFEDLTLEKSLKKEHLHPVKFSVKQFSQAQNTNSEQDQSKSYDFEALKQSLSKYKPKMILPNAAVTEEFFRIIGIHLSEQQKDLSAASQMNAISERVENLYSQCNELCRHLWTDLEVKNKKSERVIKYIRNMEDLRYECRGLRSDSSTHAADIGYLDQIELQIQRVFQYLQVSELQ